MKPNLDSDGGYMTSHDVECVGLTPTDDSTNQQALEALAILVALRLWRYHWASVRCLLHVSTDNMAALQMICNEAFTYNTTLMLLSRYSQDTMLHTTHVLHMS